MKIISITTVEGMKIVKVELINSIQKTSDF
jgi:hypothetical protein